MAKKLRYTKTQMFTLIRNWELSGASQKQFLRYYGIARSTFGYWRTKYLKDTDRDNKDKKFIPIKISDSTNASAPSCGRTEAIEIVYPNGVRLVCPSSMDLSLLKPLIVL